MARRQGDLVAGFRVPARHDQTARVRVSFYLTDQPGDLVNAAHLRVISAERTPQITINRPEIAFLATKTRRLLLCRPLLPDIHTAITQIGLTGRTAQEPEKLLRHPPEWNTFCRDYRKSFPQIEPRLVAKRRHRPDTRSVLMPRSVFQNVPEQIVILFHSSRL